MAEKHGLIIRVYSKKPEGVTEAVDRTLATIRRVQAVTVTRWGVFKRPAFHHVVVAIASDHDCGKTEMALCAALSQVGMRTTVITVAGDNSREVLNKAMERLYVHDCTHGTVISNKAAAYLTDANVRIMRRSKAPVVALSIEEQRFHGRPENTFCQWHIQALMVGGGGFDSSQGVEEIAPIVRMANEGIRPVWELIIPTTDAPIALREDGGKERMATLLASKVARQEAEAIRAGGSLALVDAAKVA